MVDFFVSRIGPIASSLFPVNLFRPIRDTIKSKEENKTLEVNRIPYKYGHSVYIYIFQRKK